MDAPVDEMGVYIPQYQLNRRESVLVDPSDPSAALAKMTVEMVGSLVRRAKSTREGPKRSVSTSVKRLDSTAEDGADGDGTRSPRQGTWKGHQKAQSHSQVLELSSTAESSLLKKRPSLRDRFKSLRIKQSTIPDAVEEEEAKTPTDARFVYRPKHQALDWTDLAAQLQVPRGPSFDASGPSSAPLPRASIEKNPFHDTLAVPSTSLSKSKSTRDPSRNNNNNNTDHTHAPTPVATAEALQKNPRQQGECRRCHSKRVQRSMSARKSTAADPRIQFDWAAYRDAKETSLPSPAYRERETTLTLSPRLSVNAPKISTPVITTTDSNGAVSKEWDPFNDYERLVREAEAAERRGSGTSASAAPRSPSSNSNNPFLRSPGAASTAAADKRGHTKAAPSWASFQDGDSDVEKVAEYRKSILLTGPAAESLMAARDTPPPSPGLPPPSIYVRPQTAAVHKATAAVPVFPGGALANRRSATMERERKPPPVAMMAGATQEERHPLPPRPLRRQRSVAQRMMDTFVRPLGGGKRSQSVKPGERTPLY